MSSPNPRDRPISIATVATVQSEAPPPYSEYDDSYVPPPNAQTQAMLRGGYLVRHPQPESSSVQEYGPAAAYMQGRPYSNHHNNVITIARAIHPGIKANGIPFPSEYPAVSARDVTPDDWNYFVNCVLRELEVPNVKGAVTTPVTVNEFRERQHMVDATIDQWNRGFFTRRGIHIVPAYSFQRLASGPESMRSASPAPTYTTERSMGQDDEIMTITIDTSPRSTRAGTPETIRELNDGDNTPPGALTPKTVDEEFAPPIGPPSPRINSIPRKPVLPKRPSQTLSPNQAGILPSRFEQSRRRDSFSSDSDSSLTSMGSLSDSDDLAEADIPAVRRTLAEEFRRDPKNWSHVKTALAQVRNEVRQQHRDMAHATKQQRAEMRAGAKELRKRQHDEMKELRKEVKGYYSTVRAAKKNEHASRIAGRKEHRQQRKDARKEGKLLKREFKHESKNQRREARHGKHTPQAPYTSPKPEGWPIGPKPEGWPLGPKPPGWPLGPKPPGWPLDKQNASKPQLGMSQTQENPMTRSPVTPQADPPDSNRGRRAPGQNVPRAMSSVSFDGSGTSPIRPCRQSCSPRRGPSADVAVQSAMQYAQCPITGRSLGRRQGPIGMAKDYLMAQANASFERLRMDGPSPGPAARAGESSEWGKETDGQETGVVKK